MKPLMMFVSAWMVPGLGHYMQGKRVKGVVFFFGILALFVLGLIMSGGVTDLYDAKPLTFLGFLGSLGSGSLYFLAKIMGLGAGDIAAHTYFYGTTYVAVAGFLNLSIALKAFGIAKEKKDV